MNERPEWVGPDGFPLSWAHYQYGLTYIARRTLRRQLELAQAVKMAGVVPEDWDDWQKSILRSTEVPRG